MASEVVPVLRVCVDGWRIGGEHYDTRHQVSLAGLVRAASRLVGCIECRSEWVYSAIVSLSPVPETSTDWTYLQSFGIVDCTDYGERIRI